MVGKIGQISKDRDEAHHHVVALKRQNEDLVETNNELDEKFLSQKKKSKQFEEQLKRLETKVTQNDIHLATQVIFSCRWLAIVVNVLVMTERFYVINFVTSTKIEP